MIGRAARAWWQVKKGRQVSGFTHDPYWYGGLQVYEPLDSKWRRYHARCRQPGCTGYWLDHALKAGFRQVGKHQGYFGLVGPGLTEGIDESRLTANALWEAVTGTPGNQDWYETVHVIERDGMPMTGCEVCGGLRCKEPGRTAGCAPSATGKPSPELSYPAGRRGRGFLAARSRG